MSATLVANGPSTATDQLDDTAPAPEAADELIEEVLLLEEISIDGMCGVY